MLYIWELSNKFDLNHTTRVLHTGAQRFLRNPAPWRCIIHKYQSDKNLNKKDTLLQTLPFEKKEECDSKSKIQKWQATETKICASTANDLITGKMNAEPRFKTTSPARTARAENTGRNNTLMRKRLTDQLYQSQHSRIMSHHWSVADRCWLSWF